MPIFVKQKQVIMSNPYIKQFPDLMVGKKVLYVHGFASSGQSGTVSRIREVLPSATVVAPDLPLHPQEALDLLLSTCEAERPDLIIGTSMGGMFAEMLYGYDRIVVNPAFQIGDTMVSHNLVGAQKFQNPRQDGVMDFIVTKSLVKEYKEITQRCFSGVTAEERERRVVGLFGDNDDLVDTFDIFASHYRHAIRFHGEHRMSDKSFMHSVMPVVRWFDDRQEQRERPVVYIDIDALRDSFDKPFSSSQKVYRRLIENYSVYVVAPSASINPSMMGDIAKWVEEFINVPAYNRIVFTNHPRLLYGDYLISTAPDVDFMGTHIPFGSDVFKTWEEILTYFDRLGGQ